MSDSKMFKALADWEIFGDVDAREYVGNILSVWEGSDSAPEDEPDRYIKAYGVTTHEKGGPFGLQYISFWVETPLSPEDAKRAHDAIKARLDRMVGVTDISIRWVELAG